MVRSAALAPHRTPALAAQLTVAEALRRICRQQLEAVERHRPGARRGHDPEELHDLRVAVRRTRSALGEFRTFCPAEALAWFRGEFRWVGEISGPVRDLDVYLEHLPAYRALLSPAAAATLEPFRDFLQRHRRKEQRRLARRLDSVRVQCLLADWRRFLDGVDSGAWPAVAARPVGEVARRHLWKLYRRFLRQGAAIKSNSPDTELHRLRITGKKLRYLVEFFRTLYPPAEIAQLIKAMKGIQDYLGACQDCTVQQAHLQELTRQMADEGALPVETQAALAQLVERLGQRQQELRREFPQQFRIFSQGRGRRGFTRLYAPPKERA